MEEIGHDRVISFDHVVINTIYRPKREFRYLREVVEMQERNSMIDDCIGCIEDRTSTASSKCTYMYSNLRLLAVTSFIKWHLDRRIGIRLALLIYQTLKYRFS
jgi:hypothetical protein